MCVTFFFWLDKTKQHGKTRKKTIKFSQIEIQNKNEDRSVASWSIYCAVVVLEKKARYCYFMNWKKTKNGWKNRGKKVGSSTNKVDDISINSFGNDYCYFLRMMTNRKNEMKTSATLNLNKWKKNKVLTFMKQKNAI